MVTTTKAAATFTAKTTTVVTTWRIKFASAFTGCEVTAALNTLCGF